MLTFFLLFLLPLSRSLKLKIEWSQVESQSSPRIIGNFLHQIPDYALLNRLLIDEAFPVPFERYYNATCHLLTWDRIDEISQNPEHAKTLLNPECLTLWPGLWVDASAEKLKNFLSSSPASNPILAFGSVLQQDSKSIPLLRALIEGHPQVIKVLLACAEEAMLVDGLLFEDSLITLMSLQVLSIEVSQNARLFTPRLIRSLAAQLPLQEIKFPERMRSIDRFIWSLNFGYLLSRPPRNSAQLKRIYNALNESTNEQRRKTPLSRFVSVFLRPVNGIMDTILQGEPLSAEHVQAIAKVISFTRYGALPVILLRDWMSFFISADSVNSCLIEELRETAISLSYSVSTASLLQAFDQKADLSAVLQTQNHQTIPMAIATHWLLNRNTAHFSALITHFPLTGRISLFRKSCRVHPFTFQGQSVFQIKLDDERSVNQTILEDVLELLIAPDAELLNAIDLRAESQLFGPNTRLLRNTETELDWRDLLKRFFCLLMQSDHFSENGEDTFWPNFSNHPFLWLALGRLITICFQRGVKLSTRAALNKQLFQSVFEHKFLPDALFTEKSRIVKFQALQDFECSRTAGSTVDFPVEERVSFPEWKGDEDASVQLALGKEGKKKRKNGQIAVQQGIWAFWVGLEPLTHFFTAEEVYSAVFEEVEEETEL